MSLGGVRDEAEIRGHRRTYIGAIPGRIISSIRQCGSMDPVFLLDEVDKLNADLRGDPASALLEALDPEQNNTFTDHYMDVPFDLSKTFFITTANTAESIPAALLDRMEVIEVPSYTLEEKVQIAKRHLIKKQLAEHGLKKADLKLSEKTLRAIVEGYTREAGVRALERELAAICRKVAMEIIEAGEGERPNKTIGPERLAEYLGPARYLTGALVKSPEVGVANGLAWTGAGGSVMPVEVSVMPGKGKVDLTGRLGDIMKESARIALSYVRSQSRALGIDSEFYLTNDLHIHVPEGAVPKDGPSAGVAIMCAMVSALTGRPARQDIAMTGEVTLRGRVLSIGGVKEKLLAAYRTGVRIVLLPKDNEKDLEDIPPDVRARLDIRLIDRIDQALDAALIVNRADRRLYAG
jgi:ATP-dependent Lon protease